MVALLCVASVLAGCGDYMRNSIFSPTVIAKAIERLDGSDRVVFADILSGAPYYSIAKKHKLSIERVVAIAEQGSDYLYLEKDLNPLQE